ncbi:hypothetical protein B0H19DRAFT_1241475 [Mycena capillaripes]|nr:hypothetical protein B0H19DRAFT_1241475 [Mycena capillaripes]
MPFVAFQGVTATRYLVGTRCATHASNWPIPPTKPEIPSPPVSDHDGEPALGAFHRGDAKKKSPCSFGYLADIEAGFSDRYLEIFERSDYTFRFGATWHRKDRRIAAKQEVDLTACHTPRSTFTLEQLQAHRRAACLRHLQRRYPLLTVSRTNYIAVARKQEIELIPLLRKWRADQDLIRKIPKDALSSCTRAEPSYHKALDLWAEAAKDACGGTTGLATAQYILMASRPTWSRSAEVGRGWPRGLDRVGRGEVGRAPSIPGAVGWPSHSHVRVWECCQFQFADVLHRVTTKGYFAGPRALCALDAVTRSSNALAFWSFLSTLITPTSTVPWIAETSVHAASIPPISLP